MRFMELELWQAPAQRTAEPGKISVNLDHVVTAEPGRDDAVTLHFTSACRQPSVAVRRSEELDLVLSGVDPLGSLGAILWGDDEDETDTTPERPGDLADEVAAARAAEEEREKPTGPRDNDKPDAAAKQADPGDETGQAGKATKAKPKPKAPSKKADDKAKSKTG